MNKKGFTLVEVIVVLVILAILAAILVPSMVGWIDKANQKKHIAECRVCVVAAQTLASEGYGAAGAAGAVDPAEVLALAQVEGAVDSVEIAADVTVRHLVYTAQDGVKVVYCGLGGCAECGNSDAYTVDGSVPGGGGHTPQQTAGRTFSDLTAKFKQLQMDNKLNNSDSFDGVNAKTEGMSAKVMYDSLSAEQQAYLDGISWSIVKSGAGWRLYFTETNYGSGNASDIKVYKYDPDSGKYQYATKGTEIVAGKVKASGTSWSEWSDTMD
ncbi:prepilin-type N-terminal cleavage/methylation domain-containing protein [Gehongia tenuis]|nr:prepilin-type N-terminal cleavage/methylation domain-containing protein [Gehongia tenuis]